ncbi:MAG: D-sedoheptulose 7-phosphate isomerase [Candidatus Woesearchaeota archaeon]
MKQQIIDLVDEHFSLRKQVLENADQLEKAATAIIDCLKSKHKVLVAGNGGSAADSQHFVAELVGRFKMERKGLPAIALTTDSSILTAVANDYGFDRVFERQVEALCQEGDCFIGITTSGNSANIVGAIDAAKRLHARTISLNGRDGGLLKGKADIEVLIQAKSTARVQEAHILCIHIICELVEGALFR